jgi:hypothetical protein
LFGCVALKVIHKAFSPPQKEGENLSFKKMKSLPHLAQNLGFNQLKKILRTKN